MSASQIYLPITLSSQLTFYLEPRQSRGKGFLAKRKAFKVEDLPSKLGVSGAKRVRITYGPYKIKGTKVSREFVLPASVDVCSRRMRVRPRASS